MSGNLPAFTRQRRHNSALQLGLEVIVDVACALGRAPTQLNDNCRRTRKIKPRSVGLPHVVIDRCGSGDDLDLPSET